MRLDSSCFLHRTFDQYSNIVVEDTVERKILGDVYYDDPVGIFLIRGENIVLMGEVVIALSDSDFLGSCCCLLVVII